MKPAIGLEGTTNVVITTQPFSLSLSIFLHRYLKPHDISLCVFQSSCFSLGPNRWGSKSGGVPCERLCSDCQPKSVYWHVKTVSGLIWDRLDRQNTYSFLQIRSKPHVEVVWNVIPIGFLQIRLSLDALAARIRFQSVFCVTRNMTHNNDNDCFEGRNLYIVRLFCWNGALPAYLVT